MKEVNQADYLQDLRSFRWELYHYRNSTETIKSLTRYYFKKYYFQHFAEEIVIAGYDLQNVSQNAQFMKENYFFSCSSLQLNGDIRQEVYLHIPSLSISEFPSIVEEDDALWDLNRFFICLLYQNESSFIKGFELVAKKRPSELCEIMICNAFILWQLDTWLSPSILQHLGFIFQKMRSDNVFDELTYNTVEHYREHFHFWKGKRYTNIVDVVDAVMQQPKFRHKKINEHFNRGKCIETLIDWDLNVTMQLHLGQTALFYAAKCNNVQAISKLLTKGSFIGSATNLFDPRICNIDSKFLENHFDNCITRCVDDDRFIEIDFKNLISNYSKDCENCDGSCSDEMKAIEIISQASNHKRLLVHPLIWTFVLLKWNQLAFFFHVHFILYIVFTLSTIGYIWCVVNGANIHLRITFAVLTIIFMIYVILRRICQFHHLYTFKTNYKFYTYILCVRTALIVFIIVLLLIDVSEACRSIFASICIMLLAFELFILAGSLLWSFSKYYVMFLDVATSSIKSLQLCLILLPAFSMSFYLLLWSRSSTPNKSTSIDSDTVNGTYRDADSFFSRLRSSIIRIIAMSAGEFEVANSHFDSSVVSANLFLVFLFLISIVFMNLMNGLAVSDTQKIQADAEATSMIQVLDSYIIMFEFKIRKGNILAAFLHF